MFNNYIVSKRIRSAVLACLIAGISTAHASENLTGRTTAPDFELQGINQLISLNDYRGSVVYVDFWASWCTPCLKSFPWMNDLKTRHAEKGLKVIAINLDENSDDAFDFLEATRPNFVIAYDPTGQTARDYRVMGMPSSYIIDRNGKLSWKHIGFRKKDIVKLEMQLVAALEE